MHNRFSKMARTMAIHQDHNFNGHCWMFLVIGSFCSYCEVDHTMGTSTIEISTSSQKWNSGQKRLMIRSKQKHTQSSKQAEVNKSFTFEFGFWPTYTSYWAYGLTFRWVQYVDRWIQVQCAWWAHVQKA